MCREPLARPRTRCQTPTLSRPSTRRSSESSSKLHISENLKSSASRSLYLFISISISIYLYLPLSFSLPLLPSYSLPLSFSSFSFFSSLFPHSCSLLYLINSYEASTRMAPLRQRKLLNNDQGSFHPFLNL